MRERRSDHMVRSWRPVWRSMQSLCERRRAACTFLPVLMFCLAVGISACDRASSAIGSPTRTPAPTATPTIGRSGTGVSLPFPTFSDWRVAYVAYEPGGQGDTGQLQAISPDGTATVAGPELAGISPHYDLQAPSVSPNGRLVAIDTSSGLNIVELTGRHRVFAFGPEEIYRSIAWSPDSAMLAVAGATWDGVDIIRMSDGSVTKTPAIVGGVLPDIIGWVDATHVIGYYFPAPPVGAPTPTPPHSDVNPPEGVQTLTLATEDITSGAVHKVVSITSSTMGQGFCALSPDGRFALFFNRAFRANPYVPDARLIDVATGAVTSLPNIAHAMGAYSGFTSVAWQEDSMTVAASSGLASNGDLKTWLLDLSRDSGQPLPYQAYIAGWIPAGGLLVLTSEQTDVTDGGPYQISVVKSAAGGLGAATVLTTNAYTFPFVGFIHTS